MCAVSSVPERQHEVGEERDGRQRGRDRRGYHQVHSVLGRTHLEGELESSPVGEYDAGGYGQHQAVPARHNQALQNVNNKMKLTFYDKRRNDKCIMFYHRSV